MAGSKTEQIKEQSHYLRETIRETLRNDASDEAIQKYLKSVVLQKEDQHHIGEPEYVQPQRSMSCIGG